MTMPALRDARVGNIRRELTMICGFQKLGERATIITVHLDVKCGLLLRKIVQIHGIQLHLKGTLRYGRHAKVFTYLLCQGQNSARDSAYGRMDTDRALTHQ